MTRPDITTVHTKTLNTLHGNLHDQTNDYREAFGTHHKPLTIIRAAHRIYYLNAIGEPTFMDQLSTIRSHLKPYVEGVNFNQLSDRDEAQVEGELITIIRSDAERNPARQHFLNTLLASVVDIPTGPLLTPFNANTMAYYTVLRLEELIQQGKYQRALGRRLTADEKIETAYKPESAMLNNGIVEGLLHLPYNHFRKHATDFYRTLVGLTRLKVGDEHLPQMMEYLYTCFKGAVSAAAGSIEFQKMMPLGTEFHLPFLLHDIDPLYHYDGYMLNFQNATFVGVLQSKSSSANTGQGTPFLVKKRGQQLDLTNQVQDIPLNNHSAARVYAVANFIAGPNPQGKAALTPVGVAYWQPTFRSDGKWANSYNVEPTRLTRAFAASKEIMNNTHTHLFHPTDPTLPLDGAGVTVLISCVNYYDLEREQQLQKEPFIQRLGNLINAFYEYAKQRGTTPHKEYFE